MAALAEETPTTFLRIVEPVVIGERPCVDAHRQHEIPDAVEYVPESRHVRGEPPVEAHHQHGVV